MTGYGVLPLDGKGSEGMVQSQWGSFGAFCRLFIELSFKPKLDIRSKFLYPEAAAASPRFGARHQE